MNEDELSALCVTRARLARHTNRLWERWARRLGPTDGFQIEVVQDPRSEQLLLRTTLYGGASFVGKEADVLLACRSHLRRAVRRRAPVALSR
jgi:hypothetical protein